MTKAEEKYMDDAREALYKADAIADVTNRQLINQSFNKGDVDSVSLINSIYEYIEKAINCLSDMELYGDEKVLPNRSGGD